MITRCDHCGSKFEVSAELVFSNDPGVRCGECLSLFDARANLFNEDEYNKAAATLKPVQKSKPVKKIAETVSDEYLETAETVAVEHIYTSAGIKTRSLQGEPELSGDYSAAVTGSFKPQSEHQSGNHAHRRSSADLEFERTIATESSFSEGDAFVAGEGGRVERSGRGPINTEALDASGRTNGPNSLDGYGESDGEDAIYGNAYRSVAGPTPLHHTDSLVDDELDDHEVANRKRQKLREQEQRALQLEPERDFESLESIDFALDQSRKDETREELTRRRITERSRLNDRHLAQDGGVVSLDDSHFIPDDVLNRPAIHRDNGRRSEQATRFKADTPAFDISLDDDQVKTDTTRRQHARSFERSADKESGRYSGNSTIEAMQPDDRSAKKPEPDFESRRQSPRYRRDTSDLKPSDKVFDDPSLESRETSAQEMRRYQRHRPSVDPSVDVEPLDEDLLAQRQTRVAESPPSRAGAIFWMAGLILAFGLLLFAARGVIANMNLPEPVIVAFCQVTGCVPDQAKKDVSQLQSMRQGVYPHPEIENAMVISVDVVNNSIYKQPLPTLAVTLLDADGEAVAERDFDNASYEVVDGREIGHLLPGEPTRIKIEVIDTGLAASDVEIAFE